MPQTKMVYVAYCVKEMVKGNDDLDEWYFVLACPPKPGEVNWNVSEVQVGQRRFYPTLDTVRARVDSYLQPMLDKGYTVEEESEQTIRQLSTLPCPLIIRDRREWLQFLRNKYPKMAVVSPLINAGKRRHLTRTKNKPPLFVVLTEGEKTHRWVHQVYTFWTDADAPEKVLVRKRSAAVADFKARGYFVVQVSLAQAHVMSGLYGSPNATPWEYPFVSWDEYRTTMVETDRRKCPSQRGKDGVLLFHV